jgi:hypothetical protein
VIKLSILTVQDLYTSVLIFTYIPHNLARPIMVFARSSGLAQKWTMARMIRMDDPCSTGSSNHAILRRTKKSPEYMLYCKIT